MTSANLPAISPIEAHPVDSQSMIDALAESIARRMSQGMPHRRPDITFGQMFDYWLTHYARPYMRPRVAKDYERMFKNYFQCWADMPVYEIKRSSVQEWKSRLAEEIGATTANRCCEAMRMIFNRCIDLELIPDNYNPATKIRRFALQARERFLQADEMPRFFAALQTLRYDATRDCLLMCLFTAQRLGNVREMRWDQIDWHRRVWTIPRTKNGTSNIVPLTPDALAVLDWRRKAAKSEWVFPNRLDGSMPISRLQKAWEELCKKAGIENLRIHDLRRSHASWQAITGAHLVAIAKTLNHRDITSTAIYARLNVEDQRKAMVTANEAMLSAAGIPAAKYAEPAITLLGPEFEIDAGDEWIDENKAAEVTGYSVSRLQWWRTYNDGPPYLKSGEKVLYKPSMLRAWLHGRTNEQAARGPYKRRGRPKQAAGTANE